MKLVEVTDLFSIEMAAFNKPLVKTDVSEKFEKLLSWELSDDGSAVAKFLPEAFIVLSRRGAGFEVHLDLIAKNFPVLFEHGLDFVGIKLNALNFHFSIFQSGYRSEPEKVRLAASNVNQIVDSFLEALEDADKAGPLSHEGKLMGIDMWKWTSAWRRGVR
jgi:hypothetical protein